MTNWRTIYIKKPQTASDSVKNRLLNKGECCMGKSCVMRTCVTSWEESIHMLTAGLRANFLSLGVCVSVWVCTCINHVSGQTYSYSHMIIFNRKNFLLLKGRKKSLCGNIRNLPYRLCLLEGRVCVWLTAAGGACQNADRQTGAVATLQGHTVCQWCWRVRSTTASNRTRDLQVRLPAV